MVLEQMISVMPWLEDQFRSVSSAKQRMPFDITSGQTLALKTAQLTTSTPLDRLAYEQETYTLTFLDSIQRGLRKKYVRIWKPWWGILWIFVEIGKQ